ncbi:MAG: hypothetical protein ACNA77_07860 [Opitutales bacterium]
MLHRYYKWRYERKARSGAFTLPKTRQGEHWHNANLSSYISHTAGPSHGLRSFDLSRRRRKLVCRVVTILVIALLAWITYESLIAIAMIGK